MAPTKLPEMIYKFSQFDPESKADVYGVTLSDGSVDRHGDTISPDGWQLDAYKANPVLLWAHDASQLPLGKTLNVRVEDGKLRGYMVFAKHEFAQVVKALVDDGTLRAVSVGFAPKEYEPNEERTAVDAWFSAIDFKSQELLELSVVPVPANPNALIDAKSKGLNVGLIAQWAERALECTKGTGIWIPRAQLEATVRSLTPTKLISIPAQAPLAAPADVSPEKAADLVRSAVDAHLKQLRMKRTGKLD